MNTAFPIGLIKSYGFDDNTLVDINVRQDKSYVNTFYLDVSYATLGIELVFLNLLVNQMLMDNKFVFIKGPDEEKFIRYSNEEGYISLETVDLDPRREDANLLS